MPVKGSGLGIKVGGKGTHGQVFYAVPVQQFQSRFDNGFLGKSHTSSKFFKKAETS
jgi:hypothetical protein